MMAQFLQIVAALVALGACFLGGRLHALRTVGKAHDEAYAYVKREDLNAERVRATKDREALAEAQRKLATLDQGKVLAEGAQLAKEAGIDGPTAPGTPAKSKP